MFLALNPKFEIRNEKNCSYLIKRNGTFDSEYEKGTESVTILPLVIGYILQMVGMKPYQQSLNYLSEKLKVSVNSLDIFLKRISTDGTKRIQFCKKTITIPPYVLVRTQKVRNVKDIQPVNLKRFNQFGEQRPKTPINVNFMITTKCTTDCCYCYAKRHFDYELSLEEICSIIDECYKLGVVNLNLTGGDVFARKDWRSIIRKARFYEYNPFLSTKTPITDNDISFLKDVGITEIQFSIDSIENETLKDMINVKEDYISKVEKMFESCNNSGIKLCIRTVLCRQNTDLEQFGKLYTFLSKFQNIKDWVLTPAFFSEYKMLYEKYAVSNNSLIEISEFVKRLKTHFPIYLSKFNSCGYNLKQCKTVHDYVNINQKCYANSFSMSILSSGVCTICEMLYENKEYTIGNVRNQRIIDIWNGKKALDLYSPIQSQMTNNSPCHNCTVFDKCRTTLAKRVCYVDIAKVNGIGSLTFPDPRCPKSKDINVIL